MKKYTYVTVNYQMKDIIMASMDEHREIIDRYASEGYTYVGMIPTELNTKGCYRKIDLIFEKEAE